MADNVYRDIRDSLRTLYLEDDRPWLVGFSGGKDSTLVASLIVETVAGLSEADRKKPVAILCTDRGNCECQISSDELPCPSFGTQHSPLDISRSFWVNIIGRGRGKFRMPKGDCRMWNPKSSTVDIRHSHLPRACPPQARGQRVDSDHGFLQKDCEGGP